MTPKQAGVYVDGYFAGRVDDFDGRFERLHLEAGEYEIAIYLPGHRTLREFVHLSPNKTGLISGTLERLAPGDPDPGPPRPIDRPPVSGTSRPQPDVAPNAPVQTPPPAPRGADPASRPLTRFGTLTIQVEPGGAELAVGDSRRTLGSSGERVLIQLVEGRHRLAVSKRGYLPYSTEVELKAGETLDLDISLTREK